MLHPIAAVDHLIMNIISAAMVNATGHYRHSALPSTPYAGRLTPVNSPLVYPDFSGGKQD
jgi:hypothetical protein